jgi:hypothetical protein
MPLVVVLLNSLDALNAFTHLSLTLAKRPIFPFVGLEIYVIETSYQFIRGSSKLFSAIYKREEDAYSFSRYPCTGHLFLNKVFL